MALCGPLRAVPAYGDLPWPGRGTHERLSYSFGFELYAYLISAVALTG